MRRLLQLDEIADVRILADLRPGPDVRERTEERAGLDCGIGDHSVVSHTHPIADRRVDDARAGVDLAGRADLRRALEEDAWMDHRVGADDDVGVDVGGGGIDQRDAGGHQLFVLLLADHGADLCKFSAAVDAANLFGALDRPGRDRALLFAIDRDQIGQVVLALFVRGADRVERVEQRRQIERVDAGVDFGDRLLRRRWRRAPRRSSRSGRWCGRCGRSRTAAAGSAVTTWRPRRLRACVSSSACSGCRVSSGTSPDSSTTVPGLAFEERRASAAARGRCPSCCSWSTNWSLRRLASDALTSSAPWPTTSVMLAGCQARPRSAGRVRSGSGRRFGAGPWAAADFIRVPLPAAKHDDVNVTHARESNPQS